MAGGASSHGDDEIGGINVTPFVDIALVLLIIFMVTAKYIVSQAIPVDLPEAATAHEGAAAAMVGVSVDRAQRIFVGAQPVTERELVAHMRARRAADAEVRAVINADRAVPHGRVTQVIDLVRQAGVTRFAIQTEQSPDAERAP